MKDADFDPDEQSRELLRDWYRAVLTYAPAVALQHEQVAALLETPDARDAFREQSNA